jgi:hypothetical protein
MAEQILDQIRDIFEGQIVCAYLNAASHTYPLTMAKGLRGPEAC